MSHPEARVVGTVSRHSSRRRSLSQGTPGSPGIAFGPVHVVARGFHAPEVYEIKPNHVQGEQDRFSEALDKTKVELDDLRSHIDKLSGDDHGKIFDAHLLVLEDKSLITKVNSAIVDRHQNAEYAFYAVMQTFLEAMRRINDPYLRERAADIDDVCQRVLRNFKHDEEHDFSYKQFDPAPRYHARDAAILLAQLHQAKTLLGSATPSLESTYNAEQSKYGLVNLDRRYGEVQLPEIALVDIKEKHRKKRMKGHFSDVLITQITEAVENKEQVILFQNRRGYSPVVECETCAVSPQCPNCDVSLTFHKYRNELRCHYCNYRQEKRSFKTTSNKRRL